MLDSSNVDPRTPSRYERRLEPVLDHVRENLTGDLSVAALASTAHFSPYHFHRVFRAIMGETVATFVRRARLERAIQLMKTVPDRSLTDVAAECGFSSLSEFSRTFRRHLGSAPSRWDRRTPLVFSDRKDDRDGSVASDLEAMIASDELGPVETRLRETPALRLAYVRIRRPFEPGALQHGYERLRSWLDRRGLPRRELLGLSWDDVEITPLDRIRYDFACSVPTDIDGKDEQVGFRDLPALVVVSAEARGDLGRVARVWDHLYHEWLPTSRFEPYNLPPFERYRAWPDRLEESMWDLDCCIPLKPLETG